MALNVSEKLILAKMTLSLCCTDIKATVTEKTLLVTFISVVCIVYMKSLLNEVLFHEELFYSSVFT